MSNVIFNNFTSGLVTPKLAGNYGSNAYHNGCSVLENFSVMLQGGITRRPPLRATGAQVGDALRTVPFIIDVDEAYLVELGIGYFRMWLLDPEGWTLSAVELGASSTTAVTPFDTRAKVLEVQFSQSADVLYLAQRDTIPQKVALEDGYWRMSNVDAQLTLYTDASGNEDYYDPMEEAEDAQGRIFRREGGFPAVTAFNANRLWFACSKDHPNRYWASQPFEHESFAFYEMVPVENVVLDEEGFMAALSTTSYDSSSTYAEGDKVTYDGYIFRCKEAIATPEEFNPAHWEYAGTVELSTKKVIIPTETVTEDCGIRFDASGNDAVRWISAKGNIIVGTASGEYAIPGSANGINYSLSDLSSYGSQRDVQPVQGNGEVLFVQAGGRKLRGLSLSSGNFSCIDLTYQCDRLLAEHGGAVRMAWRRVPDPTLYVVLSDGTMAVLFYDNMYGLCAWAHWTFRVSASSEGRAMIKDVCVLDREDGQTVLLLVERDGVTSLEALSDVDASESMDVSYRDLGTIPYVSEMKSNPYEYNSSSYGSSLGKRKRIRAIVCRLLNTKGVLAGYDDRYMKPFSGQTDLGDIEILLPGGYDRFVQITVQSIEDKPLTLLAFSLDMEAER